MFISDINLQNFRNYETLSAKLGSGVNVFYGDNGQGKTNILESVFFCAIGKSFRFSKDSDLVKSGKNEFKIELQLKDDITNEIAVTFRNGQNSSSGAGEKAVRVNGLYLRRLGHLMGNLLSVIFSPEDLEIVNEGPSVRRKLLDIVISQIYPAHYFDLQQYNKILAQKNVLLRDLDPGNSGLTALLDVYNEQLAEAGAKISARRVLFSYELELFAAKKNSEISSGEKLSFQYYSNYFSIPEKSNLNILDNSELSKKIEELSGIINKEFIEILNSRKNREIERSHSLYGPQNDDLLITLNEMELRRFGSQGQKRTAVLSIKLAETQLLYKLTGRKPVLLLDDVFSELDETRCTLLLKNTEGFQTLLTTANLSELPREISSAAKIFFVESGSIKLI